MEPMTMQVISAVQTQDGKAIRARVKAESQARCNGVPAASISLVLTIPREVDSEPARPVHEQVYDEALKYLDIA
jgi:hypothetical protein